MWLALAIGASGSLAWGQTNKPKPAQSAPTPQPQTQNPNAQPLPTQQLPAQQVPQTQQLLGSAKTAAAQPGEVFVMPMPKGWKQESVNEHYNIRTIQFVPDGQAAEKAEEKLRSLAFFFVKDAPLETFMKLATRLPDGQCEDVFVTPTAKGSVNGYESVFATRFCTRLKKSGQGEVAMFKFIQGKYGLYLGERSWRVNAFTKTKPPVPTKTYEQWAAYMQAVTVCEPGNPGKPCPGVQKK
jgi:hypothetical protein